MQYVDGFIVPLPKKSVDATAPWHAGLARSGAHGRLEYREGVAEDIKFAAEPGPDAANVDEVATLVHAAGERAKFLPRRRPAADDHLVSLAAFGLGPTLAAAGLVTPTPDQIGLN